MTHCSASCVSLIALQIFYGLDYADSSSGKCLRLLQKICSSWTVLPPTYEVSDELSVPATLPFAFGGFCDIFKGTLAGESVCVKRLRISTMGDQAAVKQVTRFHIFGLIVKPLQVS